MNHRRRWLLLIPLAGLLALGWDRCEMMLWVGHTDLEIIFDVRDRESGQSIAGAKVEVRAQDWHPKKDDPSFRLTTGTDGTVKRDCPNVFTTGSRSPLRLTDTRSVRLPEWQFRAVAPGHEPTPWMEFDPREHGRRVERLDGRRDRLLVEFRLVRASP